jgi:hypothetical protein
METRPNAPWVWLALDTGEGELAFEFDDKELSLGVHRFGFLVEQEKSPPNYLRRSVALLGHTVHQEDVWGICAVARGADAKKLKLRGRGQAGILAAYAAHFEPSIKEVVIIDPPKSHMEGPYLLNVMRVLDIPEALGLLAPNVKLTLINARDPAFDRTAEIYRLAGAADKLTRK